jgi:hypothetical protein
MSQEWFNWENKTLIKDQVYVLHDFLKDNIYHELKHEIRHVPNVWHNNYTNRLIVENVRSPRIIEFASRLLPYLAELFGEWPLLSFQYSVGRKTLIWYNTSY